MKHRDLLTCVLLVSFYPKYTLQTLRYNNFVHDFEFRSKSRAPDHMNCTKLVADKSNVLRLGSRCEGVNERLCPEVGSANDSFLCFCFSSYLPIYFTIYLHCTYNYISRPLVLKAIYDSVCYASTTTALHVNLR